MKKNYCKPGDTVSILVATNEDTELNAIAGTVQKVSIISRYTGTLEGISTGMPVTWPLSILGFHSDEKGIYYLTEQQTKL